MQRKGSNSVHVRNYNERVVLETLRRYGEGSKAELARSANLTPQAVAGIVDALVDAGLVEPKGKRFGQVGQPSIIYGPVLDGAFSIGLHIGRRSLDAVLVDFAGQIRASETHEYEFPEPDSVLSLAISCIRRFMDALPETTKDRVIGVGLAMPYFLGGWKSEQNVSEAVAGAWQAFDLKAKLAAASGLSIHLENDASAAAVAELVHGAGRNYKNFIYFFMNTFIGGGLVLDGSLSTGAHGNSGAFGPYPVTPSRLSTVPPPAGPFEILLRRASVAVLIRHLRACGVEIGKLKDLEFLPESAQPFVDEWQEDCADALAQAIVGSIAVIDVDAVIIDSILPAALLNSTVASVVRRFNEIVPDGLIRPAIVVGSIGAKAVAIGGAILPVYDMFAPDSSVLLKKTRSNKRPLLVGSGGQR
ncbi:MAG: ROK family transcriptional regulator [Devosia sp.]|nr:ROK family transcriptional regulator [Devosia sp.]